MVDGYGYAMAMVKIDIDWRSKRQVFRSQHPSIAYAKMYRFSTAAMAWVTGSSMGHGRTMAQVTRPGEHTKTYWKWPFIVDFPIKNGDFPLLC